MSLFFLEGSSSIPVDAIRSSFEMVATIAYQILFVENWLR
jgi:hypothetical protein